MGYGLGDAAWGHGFETEAARDLLQWALDTLDLSRVPGRDRYAQRGIG